MFSWHPFGTQKYRVTQIIQTENGPEVTRIVAPELLEVGWIGKG